MSYGSPASSVSDGASRAARVTTGTLASSRGRSGRMASQHLHEEPAQHSNAAFGACGVGGRRVAMLCALLAATALVCTLALPGGSALCSGALCDWAPALRGAGDGAAAVLRRPLAPSTATAGSTAAPDAQHAQHALQAPPADMWCTGQGLPDYARACLVRDLYYDLANRKFTLYGKTILGNETGEAQPATAERFARETCALAVCAALCRHARCDCPGTCAARICRCRCACTRRPPAACRCAAVHTGGPVRLGAGARSAPWGRLLTPASPLPYPQQGSPLHHCCDVQGVPEGREARRRLDL